MAFVRAASFLKAMLATELSCYAVLGGSLVYFNQWPYWTVLPLVAAAYLLTHLFIFSSEFFIANQVGKPIPSGNAISLGALFFCMLDEMRCAMFNFALLQAFPRLVGRWVNEAARADRPTERPIVLLVHGLACNAAIWRYFRHRLLDAGWHVETINLEPVFGDLRAYALLLHDKIEAICQSHQRPEISVIGHSMGGVVIRAYASAHGHRRLSRVVTIASPHHGTWLTRWGRSPNLRQMRIGSDFLSELDCSSQQIPPDKITCVFSHHDNVVVPHHSAKLADTAALAYSGLGHLKLLFTPRVADDVLQVLKVDA